ncbi:hypothetical protein C8Q76DRAFT_853201 [Earliella scabrosa]|nr:hypothetical protein C8Q76DRAFT_853201 [Earliella scabrosa]
MTLTCMRVVRYLWLFVSLIVTSSATSIGWLPEDDLFDQAPLGSGRFHHVNHPIACRDPLDDPKFQCGLLEIPLDYHNLSAGTGRIYYGKLPAFPDVRKGTLFVDPGTPSYGGYQHTWLRHKSDSLRKWTKGEYDIVVWDARGRGDELDGLTIPGPMNCFPAGSKTERNEFYTNAARELGFEPTWNEDVEYSTLPTDEEVSRWYAVQEKLVEYCLSKTNTSMLAYMGTAASARDLVAMADVFDGSGSPVNFWGMHFGSLVGSYLVKMFPERVGRIILDNPMDPEIYAYQNPYQTWRNDLNWTNTVLEQFAHGCVHDNVTGCRLAHEQNKDNQIAIGTMQLEIVMSFVPLTGWRSSKDMTLGNVALRNLFETIEAHTERTILPPPVSEILSSLHMSLQMLQDVLALYDLPIHCGDLALGHDSDQMPRVLMSSKHDTPFLGAALPSLRYMCHLWPFRAVERYSDLQNHTSPANPILVLGSTADPRMREDYSVNVVQKLTRPEGKHSGTRPNAVLVKQAQLHDPSFGHSRCIVQLAADYLTAGKIPTRTVCYGNGVRDEWPDEDQAKPDPTSNTTPSPSMTARVSPPIQKYPPIDSCAPSSWKMPESWRTSDGSPVLFYVKALGDLQAASFGHMNLLKGDMIAVVAVAVNGWWTGELVDDGRRMGSWGAVFPRTFVCLL